MWLPYIFNLKNDFTFLMPDLPGHGGSKGSLPHSQIGFLEDYAACLAALAKTIEPNEFYGLVGYSLGAYTSLHYLSKAEVMLPKKYMYIDHTLFPQSDDGWDGSMNNEIMNQFKETHGLVVAGDKETPYLSLEKLPPHIQQSYFQALAMMNEKSLSNRLLKKIVSLLPGIPVFGTAMKSRVEWPWAYSIIKAYSLGLFDLRSSVEKVQIPTFVLCGRSNSVFPSASMEYMESRMTNVRLISFEKSNHDLIFNEPLHFGRVLRKFLYQED